MEKLNELAELARLCSSMKSSVDANAAYSNFICRIEPQDILAIAKAFRALEEANAELRQQRAGLAKEANDFETKLAELAKQEPVHFRPFGSDGETYVKCSPDHIDAMAFWQCPAPATDLAELAALVPDKLPMDIPFAGHRIHNGGWNDCIDAILRNIEELK